MARWAAVDFGAEPRTTLWRSFRSAARRDQPVLTTADVLALAGRFGAGLPRGIVGGRGARPTGGEADDREADDRDGGGVDPAAVRGPASGVDRVAPTAGVLALREARWRGARQARSSPQWSQALTTAMEYALSDARSRGLAYVNDVHLVLGLLADRDNAASRLLVRTGTNRRDLILRLRRSREVSRSGEAWAPLVRALEAFGVLRGQDLSTRAVGLLGRQVARLGGHGHPLLAVIPQEFSRQAVLLGDIEVSTAHLLLAVAHFDRQLAAAGQELPEAVAINNTAGAVLAEHGFRYDTALRPRPAGSLGFGPEGRQTAHRPNPWLMPTEAFEPVSAHVARRIWPALRNGDPAWGPRVVDLLTAARADATARGHRDGGTTHLLAVTLAQSDSAAVGWLDALGVNVDAVRDGLVRDLG